MVVIWGANFSVVKFVLREFPQVSFNALRLAIAALVFLGAIRVLAADEPAFTRDEWLRVALLGVIGHFLYQLAFVAGVARTTASNGALIFGATPIAVALMSAAAGHERVPPLRWAGAALSLFGIYIIVGRQAQLSSTTAIGDLLVFAGMLCWSLYSVLAQPLLRRHSPLAVTGYSIALGAVLYVAVAVPTLFTTDWSAISAVSWVLTVLSSLLALVFAYIVWYTAVQRIGSSRTAVYSNLTPIAAMTVAALWLNEPVGMAQLVGVTTILGGVFISRFAPATSGASKTVEP
jgi:drug/metabolite transporter (DMT)-like permease